MTFGKNNWRHQLSNNTQPLKIQNCLFPLWEADVDLPQTDCSIGNDFAFEGLRPHLTSIEGFLLHSSIFDNLERVYSNSDWLADQFLEFCFICGRDCNCDSVGLFDDFSNYLIFFNHVQTRTNVYINIRVQMYTNYILYVCVQMYMNKLEQIEKKTAEIAEEFLSIQRATDELCGKITALQDMIAEAKKEASQ